jgi:hypothetical protein
MSPRYEPGIEPGCLFPEQICFCFYGGKGKFCNISGTTVIAFDDNCPDGWTGEFCQIWGVETNWTDGNLTEPDNVTDYVEGDATNSP